MGVSADSRRLLAVIAIACAIAAVLVAASAMPTLAGEAPGAQVLGGEDQQDPAAGMEGAMAEAVASEGSQEAAVEDFDDLDDLDGLEDLEEDEREALETALAESDGDPEDLEEDERAALAAAVAAAGDGDDAQEGASLVDEPGSEAAVLGAMAGQEDAMTDPVMSDALFGVAAMYASAGGSFDGFAGGEVDPDAYDGDAEDLAALEEQLAEEDVDPEETTSSGGLLDVPTSADGMDGEYGDRVSDRSDEGTIHGDTDELAEEDVIDGDDEDWDGDTETDMDVDADASDETDDGAFDDGGTDAAGDSEDADEDDTGTVDEDDPGVVDDDDAMDDDTDGDGTEDDGTDADDSSDADDEPGGGDIDDDVTDDGGTEADDTETDDGGTEADSTDDPTDADADDSAGEGSNGDDDSSDDESESGIVDSVTGTLGGLTDRPLLAGVVIAVSLLLGYLLLTDEDPLTALRTLPSRLLGLAMGVVVACSDALERAIAALSGLRSVAELPGLLLTALVGVFASLRSRANSVRSSLPFVDDDDSAVNQSATTGSARSSARERIRNAFDEVADISSIYRLSVATPTDVASSAKAQGAPAEPVDTITAVFRDVEYGERDPDRHVERATAAEAELRSALAPEPDDRPDAGAESPAQTDRSVNDAEAGTNQPDPGER